MYSLCFLIFTFLVDLKKINSDIIPKFKLKSENLNKKLLFPGALFPLIIFNQAVYAIDPSELRSYAKPGQISIVEKGSSIQEQLKSIQEAQKVIDVADIPFIELPSGVSYREYREGKGTRFVEKGSIVTVEMSIRCKNFITNSDPGGVKYFSTLKDAPGNSLTWEIGSGVLLPGLEEGMMGMRRNSIRRIEIPSVQVFAARDSNQLPLPSDTNEDGKRRFKNLFKTKADLLFEVLVNKIE